MHIPINDARGLTISRIVTVEDDWIEHPATLMLPPSDRFFTFDVEVGGRHWLVLDPYGNDFLTPEFVERLLRYSDTDDYTIAIEKTGHLFTTHVDKDAENTDLVLCGITNNSFLHGQPRLRIPDSYVARLDELHSKKRPYSITVESNSLISFIDREIGFGDLIEDLIFSFNFDGMRLEVWGESFRETTEWSEACA